MPKYQRFLQKHDISAILYLFRLILNKSQDSFQPIKV